MRTDCSQPRNERTQAINERMARIKHKIVVLSGKGGVGKSTVAVNLATALALEGKSVGLLDIDLHGPTVPQLLGLRGARPAVEDDILIPVEMGPNLKVMSIGFLLGEQEDAVIWRGPMKAVAIEQFLGEVDWGELDYLVIDSPPGTGDEPLAVCQAIGRMDGAVIVTTPQETALSNVRRSVKFCSMLDLPVLGVIENMAGFVCPHCGEVTHVFSRGGGGAMADKAGVPLLASVPLDPAIVEAGDAGRSFIYHHSQSPAAQEFAKAVVPILALEGSNGGGDTTVAPPAAAVAAAAATAATGARPAATVTAGLDPVTRFAVPTSGGLLCPHFGHCDEFTLIDVEMTAKRIVETTKVAAPEHEPGLLPSWLAGQGAQVVIAGGMGSRAQQLFADQGVTVVTGAQAAEPTVIVEQYLAGALVRGDNVCDH
jgi:Mrp family chromosome partitioning ATPase/predicted Fe-Mo cluster-binding NifX family protein